MAARMVFGSKLFGRALSAQARLAAIVRRSGALLRPGNMNGRRQPPKVEWKVEEPLLEWDRSYMEAKFVRQRKSYDDTQQQYYTKVMKDKAAREEKARKEKRMEELKDGVLGLQNQLKDVEVNIETGFSNSQKAAENHTEISSLQSQALLLVLGILEDMSSDVEYLMYQDAKEAKKIEEEKLWVYMVLEKFTETLPYPLPESFKMLEKLYHNGKAVYPLVAVALVLSRCHFTPLEWVQIAMIANDDFVAKWSKRLLDFHERSKCI